MSGAYMGFSSYGIFVWNRMKTDVYLSETTSNNHVLIKIKVYPDQGSPGRRRSRRVVLDLWVIRAW